MPPYVSTERAHIEPWAKSKSHHIDNLVILCKEHHDQIDRQKNTQHLNIIKNLRYESTDDFCNDSTFDFESYLNSRLNDSLHHRPSEFLDFLWGIYRKYKLDSDQLLISLLKEVEVFRIIGKLSIAFDLLSICKKIMPKSGILRADFYSEKAKTEQFFGDIQSAISSINMAIELLNKCNQQYTAKWYYFNVILCGIMHRRGAFFDTEKLLLNIDYHQAPIRERVSLLTMHGRNISAENHHDVAIDIYNNAAGSLIDLGDVRGAAMRYGNAGLAYDIAGNIDKSLEYFERGLLIREGCCDMLGTICLKIEQADCVLNNWIRNKTAPVINWKDFVGKRYANAIIKLLHIGDYTYLSIVMEKFGLFWEVAGDRNYAFAAYVAAEKIRKQKPNFIEENSLDF